MRATAGRFGPRLELGGARSLDDLEVTTGVTPEPCLEYLGPLMEHQYVRAVGVRKAVSGEAIPVFRLVRRTGPEPPYMDALKQLVDPNERSITEMRKRPKNGPRKPHLPRGASGG